MNFYSYTFDQKIKICLDVAFKLIEAEWRMYASTN